MAYRGGRQMLSAKPLGAYVGREIERTIKESIASFSCKDKDVEHFLKNKAFEFEKSDSYLQMVRML
jgi:hypothetical protein